MSLEDFKTVWTAELGDLSTARVTTLWKKSKAMTNKQDIAAAIAASRAAAAKDHARREKVTTRECDIVASSQPHEPAAPAIKESQSQNNEIAPVVAEPSETVVVEPSEPVVEPSESAVAESEPAVDPVEAEVNRRWSGICTHLGVDQSLLTLAVKKLHQWIMTKDISDDDRAARVVELYECVDRLMTMRHKYGETVNVLWVLGHRH